MNTIQIKGHDGAVSIEVSCYEQENAVDQSDANWLSCTIEVSAGPFSGRYPVNLTTHDLVAFSSDLDALLADRKPKAVFSTDEGWLSLEITVNSRGSAQVVGEAACDRGTKAKLSFSFETERTCLSQANQSAADIVVIFPIKT
jgi:hypothetical protein